MCGICGTAGFANRRQLEKMNEAILHRGPDDGGVEIRTRPDGTPWVELANRRLSIIDLSPAGGALSEYASSKGWAYTVSQRNQQALSTAILRLCSEANLRQQLSRTAQKVALEYHEASKVRSAFQDALFATRHLSVSD